MAIQLVGYRSVVANVSSGGSTADFTLPLTALTGGIGTVPLTDDVIVIVTGSTAPANGNPGVTDTQLTWSELADLYRSGSSANSANLSVNIARITGTVPTSLTMRSGIPASFSIANFALAIVLRGVDPTAVDVAIATATLSGQANGWLDPPAVTPATDNAMVIACQMMTDGGSSWTGFNTAPAGFSSFINIGNTGAVGFKFALAVANKVPNPRAVAVNPGVFGRYNVSSPGANSCQIAFTLAIRESGQVPLGGGNVKVWNGSAWVAKPVKIWNGSAWVTRPAKRWNGSAWVTTSY
jgi:hypothetical protein